MKRRQGGVERGGRAVEAKKKKEELVQSCRSGPTESIPQRAEEEEIPSSCELILLKVVQGVLAALYQRSSSRNSGNEVTSLEQVVHQDKETEKCVENY